MISETRIIWTVNKGMLADYFEKNYLDFQRSNGRMSLAEILGFSRGYLSQLMSGVATTMNFKTASNVAKIFNDYSIMEILGYDSGGLSIDPLSDFPPELRSTLEETLAKVKELGLRPDSAEGQEVFIEAMREYSKRKSSNTRE